MPSSQDRRDGGRLDLQLRIKYAGDQGDSGEAEATDVSPRGARIECRAPLAVGTRLNFQLDAGDGQGVKGAGEVTWCRPRKSPTGKTVYDVGLRFDDDWLKKDRGPLGRALARFFAAGEVEPARDYTRVNTRLLAQGKGGNQTMTLTIVDMSEGGLRVTTEGSKLPTGLKVGSPVKVSFGEGRRTQVTAEVAWVADAAGKGATMNASFGLAFRRDDDAAKDAMLAIMSTLGKAGNTDRPAITLELG
ncbi:MAG: PilZ domain-containing protein [Myxococcota bacterium]